MNQEEEIMKATGIVRRIDDLGRVVIPKEIRRTMKIRNGDPLEIYVDREGKVFLKKYSPISDLGEFAREYADSLHEALGYIVCIADRDEIIAVSGDAKKDLINGAIGEVLEDIIGERQHQVINGEHSLTAGEEFIVKSSVVSPIIVSGDPIGAIVITSKDEAQMGDLEKKLAQTAASFLAKQMEG